MIPNNWQLHKPIDAVIFDCDGTLSTIEGIDELAKRNGVEDLVEPITAEAMGKSGMNPAIYEKRLNLVYPTEEQVLELGRQYFIHQAPDAISIIQLLKRLNKSIYIISAGLQPAVKLFGELLQIPADNILAVDIQFDAQGLYLDFDRDSPLTRTDGKRQLVAEIKAKHPEIVYIGDGLNDYATYDIVTRFIGYGGTYYRENIAQKCEFYIKSPSLAAVIPLSLTEEEVKSLSAIEKQLYKQGLAEYKN